MTENPATHDEIDRRVRDLLDQLTSDGSTGQ
jgi:hypothetical protein